MILDLPPSQNSGYKPATSLCCSRKIFQKAEAYTGSKAAELCGELDVLMSECSEQGWDGYNAKPLTPEAYQLAERFIRSIPHGIERPLLSADTDGCATFEWHVSPRRLLLVSVHPDYHVYYASLIGTEKNYGDATFFGRFPPTLADLVRRVYQS